jgi:hypothetical protein
MPSARAWRLIGSIVFAFMLLLLGAWMLGLIPAESQYCEYNPYTDHEKCSAYQTPVVWIRYLGWVLDAATPALTAVATVAIGIFTRTLYKATTALKSSTDKLWEAGERQLAHLEDTAQRQLRAYVFITNSGLQNLSAGQIPRASTCIKNSGQTPAYKVRHTQRFALDNFPLMRELPPAVAEEDFSVTNLGPNCETMKFGDGGRISAETIEALKAGRMALYVYGEIHYIDAFEKAHYTKYRWMTGGMVGFHSGGGLAVCKEGNEAT